MMEQERTARRTYLDILRVFACLGVIYNHVAGREMRLLSGMSGLAGLFLFYLSKTAVPLFLMISGALLLPRRDTWRQSGRRILRMVIALAAASLFYYGMNALLDGAPFQMEQLLLSVYQTGATTSFWYLYLYLGVLMMLPALQPMTRGLAEKDWKYFLLASGFFSSLLPFVYLFLPAANVNLALPLFSATLGLLLAGTYFDRRDIGRPWIWLTVGAAALLTLLPTLMATFGERYYFNFFDNYFLITVTGAAVGIFCACRYFTRQRPMGERAAAFWRKAGSLTFGTFLMGDFLCVRGAFLMGWLAGFLPVNLAGLLYTGVVFLAGMGLTWLIKRLPLVDRIL